MNKRAIALAMALALSCFNFGDKKPVGAQPLEIATALRIPGPPIVIQKPLELSLDERLAAQQLIWEYRMRTQLKDHAQSSRNTDAPSMTKNPLPEFSALLTDTYSLISSTNAR